MTTKAGSHADHIRSYTSQTSVDGQTTWAENVVVVPQISAAGDTLLVNRLLSAAASTNGTLVKASAGKIAKITGYNAAAAVRYLKLYNKATAPAPGTDTPVATIALAPSQSFTIDWANIGLTFATGIGFGLTTGSADNDTGALTANDIVGMNVYYV